MNDKETSIAHLKEAVRNFICARDWGRFHKPKHLAESICIEAAELLQLFQWIDAEEAEGFRENPSKMACIEEELADVIIYCLSMANAMNIEVSRSVIKKLESNQRKYPADEFKGKAP